MQTACGLHGTAENPAVLRCALDTGAPFVRYACTMTDSQATDVRCVAWFRTLAVFAADADPLDVLRVRWRADLVADECNTAERWQLYGTHAGWYRTPAGHSANADMIQQGTFHAPLPDRDAVEHEEPFGVGDCYRLQRLADRWQLLDRESGELIQTGPNRWMATDGIEPGPMTAAEAHAVATADPFGPGFILRGSREWCDTFAAAVDQFGGWRLAGYRRVGRWLIPVPA